MINIKERKFILNKNLPSLEKGTVFRVDKNGRFASPILKDSSSNIKGVYNFPISVIKKNKDWFSEIVTLEIK